MQNLYFCLSFCLLLSLPVSAQFSRSIAEMKRDRTQEKQLLQSQPLLVMLKREDPKELKKLARNPAGLKAYREQVASGNDLLRNTAGPAWTLSPSVEYKYDDEIEALVAANTGQLNVLEYGLFGFASSPAPMSHSWDRNSVVLPSSKDRLPSLRLTIFVKKVDFVIRAEPLLGNPYHPSDVLYCVKMVEQFAKTDGPVLRTKPAEKPLTLLLCQEDRAADLTDAQIKKVYPYPYLFVPRAEYEQAVREAKPGFGFVRMSWQGYGTISPMVYVLPSLEIVCGGDLHKLKEPLITLKDFKGFKTTNKGAIAQ